ncbi:alpha/beta fold hydrolase [Roseisalinus antarcticus]|uniref:Pyrethroid hydrolase n=1 Tax=Roseisalinus antarcticus TaxID=254357 RepID=A0A1Y5SWH9_9RHOB|nr:alpha/beta fold hydrolase [Roseisalinus antarcticus]SLN49638.1 Pyrethroid hydrolase [Roseisalinus antarcticus]
MAEIVLVHGSCHGAWCWDLVAPILTAAGHDVTAVDMPGRGEAGPIETATLDSFARAILDRIEGRAMLVGHSAGGFAITAAAEKAPEKVAMLIHVCAFVPVAGQSLADMRQRMPDPPLLGAIEVAPDRSRYGIKPGRAVDLFYRDVPPKLAREAAGRLCLEATRPQETPLASVNRAAALPRRYVLCTEDRTILPAIQQEMVADWPAAHVIRMQSGHSPFLSDPDGLAGHILDFTRG